MVPMEKCILKAIEMQKDLLQWAVDNNDETDKNTDGVGHAFTFVSVEMLNACIYALTKGKIPDSRDEILDLLVAMQKSANKEDQMFR